MSRRQMKTDIKDHAIGLGLIFLGVSLFNLNKQLKEHVETCTRASRRNLQAMLTVVGMVAADVLSKLIAAIHLHF